ncbi:MAG TPA: hypothetical protein VGG27_12675 [Magnetospirillaceae bacterium]
MPELNAWDSFYVIVGSAAGALIGLQFVVITLTAQRPPAAAVEGSAAYATPTVIHFSTVLLLSALLRAPWSSITAVAVICGVLGLGGLIYAAIVVRRIRKLNAFYSAVLEDWAFHVALPFLAYGVLVVSAFVAQAHAHEALFGVGASVLLLLFIGIHNAWDTVVYQVALSVRDRHKNRTADDEKH